MNFRKKIQFLIILAVLLVLICGVFAFCNWYTRPEQIFQRNKTELEAVISDYCTSKTLSWSELPGVQSVNVWGNEEPIVQFLTGGFGIAPASTYRGFYYSVSGKPASFQAGNEPLIPVKTGWEWNGRGDNGGFTQHIEGNWYSFEAHF